ncbi:MAG: S9 family peptidase [Planctomycetota bacterium]
MSTINAHALLVSLALIGTSCQSGSSPKAPKPVTADSPPIADVRPKKLEAHGDVRIDDYYWLRGREKPDVLAYLESENEYAAAVLAPTETLQDGLFEEMRARIEETDETVPVPDGPFEYFTRTFEGRAYPVHCRRPVGGDEASTQVLFDVNEMAKGFGFFSLGTRSPSPDHSMIAYAIDEVGRRIYDIEIRHVDRGDVERGISGTSGNLVWAEDGKTVLYTKRDPETLRSFQVWRHELETPASKDVLVYEEEDEEFSCYVTKSRSREVLMIVSSQTLTTEVRYVDATTPAGEWKVVLPREVGHEYDVDHAGDRFYIRTNRDAENFKLVSAPVDDPSNWTELLPHRFDTLLSSVDAFEGHLVTRERRGGLARLVVHPFEPATDDTPAGARIAEGLEIPFDDPTYSAGLTGNREFATRKVRYSYSSLTTPSSVYDYDLDASEVKLLKQTAVGGGFDSANYRSERVFAEASDGAAIPISLVYRGERPTSPGPLMLYGYGSYGASMDASFDRNVVSLLDRGFTYAIAHIRGGQELGRAWYENGKLRNKKNTFTDFIACAEFLIDAGFTSSDQLYAMGGSAGGLLIGAVANMRPDLFHGLIAAVPFVDVVTTMLDASIPLTTFEYDEWGNPNEEGDYRYMLSYSPYDQVAEQEYPHMLVTTGLHDSQVQYWEPAKWVAKLRAKKTGDQLLVFDCEMEAGHGGVSGRYDRLKKVAQRYAFLLGLRPGGVLEPAPPAPEETSDAAGEEGTE